MTSEDPIKICPHCGGKNKAVDQGWLKMMSPDESAEAVRCIRCNAPLYALDSPDKGRSEGYGFTIKFLCIAGVLSLVLYGLNVHFGALGSARDIGTLAYALVFVLLISSVVAHGKIFKNLKYLLIWGAIFLAALIGYSHRHDLSGIKDKVMAELVPSRGVQATTDSISFPVSSDGHFYVRALVNGRPVVFLADTGASDIVLSPRDAEHLGIRISDLRFNKFYETANGMVRGSSIQVSDFQVGHIHLSNLRVSVNEADMRHSLLGMTFFKKLSGYGVKDEVLTLYWDAGAP